MFFSGRYGNDKLNKVMLFSSIGLYVCSIVLTLIFGRYTLAGRIIQGIALVTALLALLRALSRNFPARQKELTSFMNFGNWSREAWMRVKRFFSGLSGKGRSVINLEERRKYKHLTCPQCMQKLRVPRGKGTILVTCTKCRYKFKAKT